MSTLQSDPTTVWISVLYYLDCAQTTEMRVNIEPLACVEQKSFLLHVNICNSFEKTNENIKVPSEMFVLQVVF